MRSWSWKSRDKKPWTSGIVLGPPMFIMTTAVGALLLFVSYLLLLCKVAKPRWNCRTWFEDRPIWAAVERVVAGISISISK